MSLLALVAATVTLQTPPTTFDQDRAFGHLTHQCSMGHRVPGTKAHLECRDWLLGELKKTCDEARLQPFRHHWSVTGKTLEMWNVIGTQGWKDAKVRVLLLAHWDCRPYADQERDPVKARQPVMGANDGASGVAVLLELMRVMKERRPKDLGIMVLLTDGEDLGPEVDEMLLGARHFARSNETRPNYGILLDMIGDRDLQVPMELSSLEAAPNLMRSLYRHADKIGLSGTFPMRRGEWIVDDHTPLNEAGIPTIDLIDFTYPHWHTVRDTPDKCSPASLGKVGKLLESWLTQEPVWNQDPRKG